MLKNYLKIALRNFNRAKLFSFINIFGLAIGLSVCMIISIWVQREFSYDRFHSNAHRIYRIERELFRDNLYSRWPITGGAYKQALIDDFPEIEDAVRFWRREFSIRDHQEFTHRQSMFATDPSVFNVFDFHLEEGDETTALIEPASVVLTRQNAFKFFGTDDVIGKSLMFEWSGQWVDFKVTGILEEVPGNSHIKFDMLMSISSYTAERFASWRSNYLFTYVLVSENTRKSDLEEKLKTFVSRRLEPVYGDLLSQGLGIHEVLKMHLFPITDIHLHPSENWELEPGGNLVSVYMFSSIAVLILVVACLNFMNLSTARASKRAREVSLRKTVGASRSQLKGQFIQESLLVTLFALALAVVLCALSIQAFNRVFSENLSFRLLYSGNSLVLLLCITIIVGFLAGLYPAFYLTKFEPADILQGGPPSGTGKATLRRTMVIIQFSISIALIIGMFTVYKQMRYIQHRSLGFDRENVILIPARSQQVTQGFDSFRNDLLNSPNILSIGTSNDVPGEPFYSNTNFVNPQQPDDPVITIVLLTDHDFVETYRMEVLAGRSYSKSYGADSAGAVMLNAAAVKRFGWTPDEAVGKELSFSRMKRAVVGVVKDFNFRSLHTEVEPLALVLYPDYINMVSVRIVPGDIHETLKLIRQKWESAFPGEQFEYGFLDQRMDQLYEGERKMQNIFIVFTSLSILVACLGLFGLAAFTAEIRIKEIGIRKTLGASTMNVTYLLSKEFIKWILLANLVAWPSAWFLMNRWLQNFAYKTDIGWVVFFLSSFAALMIALLTFSFQTVKAAQANPVEALKYE